MWHAMYNVTVSQGIDEEEGQIVIVKQCIYGFIARCHCLHNLPVEEL